MKKNTKEKHNITRHSEPCLQWRRISSKFYRDLSASPQDDVRRGFTLAEVLITLGIIGVVAALTIPTLVANYQARAWNTAATVFERQLDDALKVMNTQQVLAGYKTTEKFVEELQKHMKINKICSNDKLTDCMSDSVTWEVIDVASSSGVSDDEIKYENLKTSDDLGTEGWSTNLVGLQFANGMTAVLAYNPECKQDPYNSSYNGTSCVAVVYDTNGFSSPNAYSKDARVINAKLARCAFKAGDACFKAPQQTTALTKAECEALADNGYGNKKSFCGFEENDFWASALKTCGGIGNLPDEEQARLIGNYLLNTDKVKINASVIDSEMKIDKDKAATLGFNLGYHNRVAFYLNKERSDLGKCASQAQYSDGAAHLRQDRKQYNWQALCLVK